MKILFTIIAGIIVFIANAQYPGPAGQAGTTAIFKDSTIIQSWASGIEIYRGWVNIADTSVYYGGTNKASFGYPAIALGEATESSYDAVSLGDGGITILTFDHVIVNGDGPDFAIFENSIDDTFLELAFVEVSSDGERFVRFPAVSITQTETQVGGFGTVDATKIHNFAGKYRQGYGTPFDLEDLADSTDIDLNNIRFIKLIDVVGNIDDLFATYDSQGHKVNDPWPTPFNTCGFDLDAVGIINYGEEFTISGFDDLVLEEDSYWNGSDATGGFYSNSVYYVNTNSENWSGFAYSNMRDNTTAGITNQYSAYTIGGMNAPAEGGTNYALARVPVDLTKDYNMLSVEAVLDAPSLVSGFYITNSTYAYLSMQNGDGQAKKFGGETGNDPDYFKLFVWGEKENNLLTDSIEFYLADYRSEDNSKDYIVDNWRWVDLTSLGEITKIFFSLESTDNSDFGINTPPYFCMDNLIIYSGSAYNNPIKQSTAAVIAYPNPFKSQLKINCESHSLIQIYDAYGKIVFAKTMSSDDEDINTEFLSKGIYLLKVMNESGNATLKLIKQ